MAGKKGRQTTMIPPTLQRWSTSRNLLAGLWPGIGAGSPSQPAIRSHSTPRGRHDTRKTPATPKPAPARDDGRIRSGESFTSSKPPQNTSASEPKANNDASSGRQCRASSVGGTGSRRSDGTVQPRNDPTQRRFRQSHNGSAPGVDRTPTTPRSLGERPWSRGAETASTRRSRH